MKVNAAVWFVAGLALSLSACQSKSEPTGYAGYLASEWTYVAAPTSGWLADITLQEGDEVEAGSVLFRLEPEPATFELQQAKAQLRKARALAKDKKQGARPEELAVIEADIKAAEADVRLANSERRRWLKLHKEGLAAEETAERFDQAWQAARARLAALRAKLASARLGAREQQQRAAEADVQAAEALRARKNWEQEQRSVTSRVSGRVERLLYHPGEYVLPGAPVVALLSPSQLKLRFYVPEGELDRLQPGQRVEVVGDGLPTTSAVITYIASDAEYTPPIIFSEESRQKLVFMVEAKPEHPEQAKKQWRPGLPVEVFVR